MNTKIIIPLVFLLSFTLRCHVSLASTEVQWFWGLQGDRLVAFNTEGQANTLIASGVTKMKTGHRFGTQQALAILIVNGHSELYWLTTTEAKLLQFDQDIGPQTTRSWTADYWGNYVVVVFHVHTEYGIGLVIDIQTGTVDQLPGYLAVYGTPVISADGQRIRYISCELDTGPCAMYERDLERGEDRVLYSEILGRWQNHQIIYHDQHGERWLISDTAGNVTLYTATGTTEGLAGSWQETDRELQFSDDLFVSIQKNCDPECEIGVGASLDNPSATFIAPQSGRAAQISEERILWLAYPSSGPGSPYVDDELWLLRSDGSSLWLGYRPKSVFEGGWPKNSRWRVAAAEETGVLSPLRSYHYRLWDLEHEQIVFEDEISIAQHLFVSYFPTGVLIDYGDETSSTVFFSAAEQKMFALSHRAHYISILSDDTLVVYQPDAPGALDGNISLYDPATNTSRHLIGSIRPLALGPYSY